MSCGYDKPKCGCGQKTSSECVIYEGNRGDCSPEYIKESVANEIHEIYNRICKLVAHTDTTGVRVSCDGSGEDISVRDNIILLSQIVCNLKDRLDKSEQMFSECGLYYGELIQECDGETEPQSLCEFFQFILNKLMGIQETLKNL